MNKIKIKNKYNKIDRQKDRQTDRQIDGLKKQIMNTMLMMTLSGVGQSGKR